MDAVSEQQTQISKQRKRHVKISVNVLLHATAPVIFYLTTGKTKTKTASSSKIIADVDRRSSLALGSIKPWLQLRFD